MTICLLNEYMYFNISLPKERIIFLTLLFFFLHTDKCPTYIHTQIITQTNVVWLHIMSEQEQMLSCLTFKMGKVKTGIATFSSNFPVTLQMGHGHGALHARTCNTRWRESACRVNKILLKQHPGKCQDVRIFFYRKRKCTKSHT